MIIRLDYIDGKNDQYFIDEGPMIVSKDEDPGAYLTFTPVDAAASWSRQPRYGETFYVPLWTISPNPPGFEPRR